MLGACGSAKRYPRRLPRSGRRLDAAYPLQVSESAALRTGCSDRTTAPATKWEREALAWQARPAHGTAPLEGKLSKIGEAFPIF
jgi:hypothetical protein